MLEHILNVLLEYAIPACEIIAVLVILFSVVKATVFAIHNIFTPDEKDVKINLLSGLSLGLEFAMAAEIMKTIVLHELNDLLVLGIVIVMRILFALVLHFEIKGHGGHKKKAAPKPEHETEKKD